MLSVQVVRRGVGGLGEGEGGAAYREERGLQVVARKGEEGLRVGGEGAPGRRCWGELVAAREDGRMGEGGGKWGRGWRRIAIGLWRWWVGKGVMILRKETTQQWEDDWDDDDVNDDFSSAEEGSGENTEKS
ncbi:hypothetical protein LOK49_LG04G03700 [Camellia lanceoleosa]|uniref:Uncharacterized protein n=1 Tax=Camellia lanceoleosa TaxID=1840588 RepID=A0ACC0I2M2_9ERIC|nr:hypothetical protein LOK49_LG04G03700 [Camellia lanceoleosa]